MRSTVLLRALRPGPALILLGCLGGFALVGPADAGDRWFSFGVLGGATRPDPDLSRYNWDTAGHTAYGVETLAGTGRFGAGMRVVRWQTHQATGIPGETVSPAVRLTDIHLHLKAHAASLSTMRLYATGGAGRYHMSYRPDRVFLDPGGSLPPIEVEYDDVTDWSFSLGMGLEHDLGRQLVLGAEIERNLFLLDTSHRSGSEIVNSRDSFNNWNLSLRLSWMVRNT